MFASLRSRWTIFSDSCMYPRAAIVSWAQIAKRSFGNRNVAAPLLNNSWERLPRSPACLAPGQRLPPLARSCRLGVAAGAERDPPHAVVDSLYKMATIAVAQLNEDCFSIKTDGHIVMLVPAHEPRVIQCLHAAGLRTQITQTIMFQLQLQSELGVPHSNRRNIRCPPRDPCLTVPLYALLCPAAETTLGAAGRRGRARLGRVRGLWLPPSVSWPGW